MPLTTRRLACFALIALASLTSPARAQAPVVPAKAQFHLFLLVGQSNMAGRGAVTTADLMPHPRVLMLDRDGAWVPAVDPMHFDKPDVVGVGLGRSFAIALADADPDVTIGLIPAAVGGSPIDTWRPGVFYDATRSHPWDDALRRARSALPSGTLKGVLWHQGESDATETLAPGYQAKLHAVVAGFRSALQAPDVPFIAGQMGRFADAPWDRSREQVDRAHRGLPAKVRRTAFVGSDGLTHKGDTVHFDADSFRELGRRYAEAYLALVARR